jgi:Fe-S-cluster containining protein
MAKRKKRRTLQEHKAHYAALCRECESACCNHIALEIDTPTSRADYDHLRWFLFHKGVKVFIDHDRSWNLEVGTPCAALGKDGRCRSYATRPTLCRDFPGRDEECMFEDPGKLDCKKVFTSVRQFERWMRRRGIEWRPKNRSSGGTGRNVR